MKEKALELILERCKKTDWHNGIGFIDLREFLETDSQTLTQVLKELREDKKIYFRKSINQIFIYGKKTGTK